MESCNGRSVVYEAEARRSGRHRACVAAILVCRLGDSIEGIDSGPISFCIGEPSVDLILGQRSVVTAAILYENLVSTIRLRRGVADTYPHWSLNASHTSLIQRGSL